MSDSPEDLDATVRRVDPDRWLASRFIADPKARADVIALYALNDELARVAGTVSNALVGEIRLAWWREGIEDVLQGRPARGHPVLQALAGLATRRSLDGALIEGMIECRHADLDPEPFADETALFAYLDGATGGLMALAAGVLGAPEPQAQVRDAARAWGVAGLARAHWSGAPNRLPPDWSAADLVRVVDECIGRAAAHRLPVAAFPAVAYATLAPLYARKREPGGLSRQARLVWASARGRV